MADFVSDLCKTFNRATAWEFRNAVKKAMKFSNYHSDNITLKDSYNSDDCWLSPSRNCGFAVTPDRELISVFSSHAGDGSAMLKIAKGEYDYLHLNCYDTSFLRKFYLKNGFDIVRKEPGFIQGKPDVIFMEYKR